MNFHDTDTYLQYVPPIYLSPTYLSKSTIIRANAAVSHLLDMERVRAESIQLPSPVPFFFSGIDALSKGNEMN